MKVTTMLSALCALASAVSLAGTPTIDGTFDGISVWGSPVATNSTPGFSGAGATATALYVTDDANYVYFAAEVSGLATWMSFGFAIDCKSGGGNTQDTWARQIDYAFPTSGGLDQPDFVIRGNADNNWAERHAWDGSNWTGFGNNIIPAGDSSVSAANGFVECRIAKSILNMRSSKQGQVEFYLTGDQNAHGLFTSVPYDTPCAEWNPPTHQQLTNPAQSVNLPVTVSSFTIE